MGQSCISKKLEGMAKHRDGQKNELSTLALKCFFSRIWPQGPELALGDRGDDFSLGSTPSPGCVLGLEGLPAFELPFTNVGNLRRD